MQPTTIPNLAPHEVAFLLDSGETVAVQILRKTANVNPLVLCVRARQVDANGTTVLIGGVPNELSQMTNTIYPGALSSAPGQFGKLLDVFRKDACDKIHEHGIALSQVVQLPVMGDESPVL